MTQAHQFPAARPVLDGGDAVGEVRRGQVGPADDPGDQVAGIGQREQFGGLPRYGDGLHHDARGHAVRLCRGLVVTEEEIAAQRREGRTGDPVLVAYAQVPYVVVSVDDPHGRHSSQATGSAAAAPPAE
jgi:hypothetical protein